MVQTSRNHRKCGYFSKETSSQVCFQLFVNLPPRFPVFSVPTPPTPAHLDVALQVRQRTQLVREGHLHPVADGFAQKVVDFCPICSAMCQFDPICMGKWWVFEASTAISLHPLVIMAGKSPNEVDGFNGKIKVTIVGGIRSTGWWKNGDHCRLLPWKNDFSSRGLICFTRYVVIPLSQVLPVIFGEENCWITMIYPTFPPSHVDVSHFFVNLLMTFTSHFTIYCHICIMHYHCIIIGLSLIIKFHHIFHHILPYCVVPFSVVTLRITSG